MSTIIGHTRVATKNNFASSGTISFAQASFESSGIREESIEALISEEAIWLMRPNTKM